MAKVLPSEARPADACVIGIRADRVPFSSCSAVGCSGRTDGLAGFNSIATGRLDDTVKCHNVIVEPKSRPVQRSLLRMLLVAN
jgi:hypothetical protein